MKGYIKIAEVPDGEKAVGIVVFKDEVIVCTTKSLYKLTPENELVKVPIVYEEDDGVRIRLLDKK